MARRITIATCVAGILVLLALLVKPSLPNFGQDQTLVIAVCADQELPRDRKISVPENCVVAGDIILVVKGNDVALYDFGGANTGLTTACVNGCTVKAPFGASVSNREGKEVAEEMLINGCGNTTGCDITHYLTISKNEIAYLELEQTELGVRETNQHHMFLPEADNESWLDKIPSFSWDIFSKDGCPYTYTKYQGLCSYYED